MKVKIPNKCYVNVDFQINLVVLLLDDFWLEFCENTSFE